MHLDLDLDKNKIFFLLIKKDFRWSNIDTILLGKFQKKHLFKRNQKPKWEKAFFCFNFYVEFNQSNKLAWF